MTFTFFLPQSGTLKNIHLTIRTSWGNHQSFAFKTPLRISLDQWDIHKQRPVNIYLKKYKKINTILDQLKVKVTDYIKKRVEEGKTISQRELSKKVHKICIENTTPHAENSLLHYMHYYIHSRKEMICHSTYKRYKVFYRLIERFEGFLMKRLEIDKINSTFINDFIIFGQKEEYSENTIYRSIHFVKTILKGMSKNFCYCIIRIIEVSFFFAN
ncbi:hypothetical protein D1631_00260 [Chryseobacterium nematophagum]|uniref:Phage integrase SAM-like domain-containing protein n=1 Tax=Chryseobacterium nematophagum TaxID=2305228 RepID=A0A3M7TLN2_9FLAO|nr:phage integrase SAM-like domain-containing protein [Chryseobacterium nematophagum]RNA63976.1 hypothetical protein D1631_00260 [Chryseobacterium nematophagum]